MAINTVRANNYRYERKFLIPHLTADKVRSLVRLHPAMFREIYHQRYVNNIYFDTVDMKSYFDSVCGAADRLKIRVRWYGELFGAVEKPVLEFKFKKGFLGAKESYPLGSFHLDERFGAGVLKDMFEKSDIPHILKIQLPALEPALLNRYSRRYYLSADGQYRITLDSEMQFYSISNYHNSYLHRHRDLTNVVLELKYDSRQDRRAHNITKHFAFRMTRSSKYLAGVESLAF